MSQFTVTPMPVTEVTTAPRRTRWNDLIASLEDARSDGNGVFVAPFPRADLQSFLSAAKAWIKDGRVRCKTTTRDGQRGVFIWVEEIA
jgi:hypothetical protein